MIRNDEIQASLVAKLKSIVAVTALVTAVEIREDQWQGTKFAYPNIRVGMISDMFLDDHCGQSFDVRFLVFTEDASSQNADKIAGIIGTSLDKKSFTSVGLRISTTVVNLIPAIRSDIRTWRSECLVKGLVAVAV